MTKTTLASVVSSPPTTASTWPEIVRRGLAPVPETRGTQVVVLAPVVIDAPLPEGFTDIDALVAEQEKDPVVREAIAAGRQAVADKYYASGTPPLAWFRLKKGWSQKDLAGRLGTSQSYIARLEAGAIDPQVSTLQRLAAVFEVPAVALLESITQGAKP